MTRGGVHGRTEARTGQGCQIAFLSQTVGVTVAVPESLDEALGLLAAEPDTQVLAGGTDFMVEVNYGHRRPPSVLSLRRVDEIRGWRREGDTLELGAGLRYVEMMAPALAELAPALAQAARTVGSPQIRNTGTLGGNLATASPAGDTLPVLAALDAVVTVASRDGERSMSLDELIVGVKRTTLAPHELITAVRVPVAAGPQEFLKIGTRNAMVISVASTALVVDLAQHTVACALGSVTPTPVRCPEAEAMVIDEIDWDAARIDDPRVYETFGTMCAAAASPIDDHRSTAAYRRHGIAVMARRALLRAL
jgi:CO/xanthine dehydrogenase FAD-binding subunit